MLSSISYAVWVIPIVLAQDIRNAKYLEMGCNVKLTILTCLGGESQLLCFLCLARNDCAIWDFEIN